MAASIRYSIPHGGGQPLRGFPSECAADDGVDALADEAVRRFRLLGRITPARRVDRDRLDIRVDGLRQQEGAAEFAVASLHLHVRLARHARFAEMGDEADKLETVQEQIEEVNLDKLTASVEEAPVVGGDLGVLLVGFDDLEPVVVGVPLALGGWQAGHHVEGAHLQRHHRLSGAIAEDRTVDLAVDDEGETIGSFESHGRLHSIALDEHLRPRDQQATGSRIVHAA